MKFEISQGLKSFLLEGIFLLLLAAAIGHSGPYGTYELWGFFTRLAFWCLAVMLPWLLFKTLFSIALRMLPNEVPRIWLNLFLMPLFAILGSAVMTYINLTVGLYSDQRFMQVWPQSIITWLVFSLLVILPMMSIASKLAKEQRRVGVTTMMEFFHYKLPESLKGGELLALKAEDHYLRVITDRGSALILMKFEDALAALNGYPGIQSHRSWWIAANQLKGFNKLDSKTSTIRLSDGTEVPVSRRKRKSVNEYVSTLLESD